MCKRLHELGFVAYYDDAKLRDWVITNPQKIIDAIAALITSKVRCSVFCFVLFEWDRSL